MNYTWLIPIAIAFSLSLRSPYEGSVTDYEIENGLYWSHVQVETLFERESGEHFYGYRLKGSNAITGEWEFSYDSHVKTAYEINRQQAYVGRRWSYLGVGAGAIAEDYQRPKGAVEFWCPLPNGQVTYVTDFHRRHIWEVESHISITINNVEPYLLGCYYYDNPSEYWQIKCGAKWYLNQKES